MATNFTNIDSKTMGLLLDIMFTKGARDQLPQTYREFELIKPIRVERTERESRSRIQTSRGPARVQAASPGSSTTFPAKQQAVIKELVVKLKEYDAITSIDIELFERLRNASGKAADELAIEMEATMMNLKRRSCIDLFGDGSGIMVRNSGSVTETKGDSTNIDYVDCTAALIGATISSVASPGSVTFLELDDILTCSDGKNSAVPPTESSGSAFYGWQVLAIDVDAGTFRVQPVDSSGVLVEDITASNIVDGTCFHRIGDKGSVARVDSVSDWGIASNYMVGLESLTATDGRTVHGVAMTGPFKGTRHDGAAALIDLNMIQKAISKAKRAVGEGAFKWDNLVMSYQSFDAFVDSKESDRRFISVDDNTRGSKKFAYQHGNDTLNFLVSEFSPLNRCYAIPTGGKSGKVLEMHAKDAQHLKTPDGSSWHLNVSGGAFEKSYVAFHMMFQQLVCNHPAAIAVLTNFVNS
jgi:hypothetical protein